jgi:hypothetical protein
MVGALLVATCVGSFHGPACAPVNFARGFALVCK